MKVFFSNIKTDEPVFLRNLTIYPVCLSTENGLDIASVDEVMDTALGEFHELDTALIDEIGFENQSDKPVLMLDGEEITGSLQNRIIAASTLIEPRVSANIEVICAEEGRWSELGIFKTGYCSYPGIRTLLSRHGRKGDGIQKTIWKEIERKLTTTRTLSSTSSMHDIYNNLQEEVDSYVEGFESLNHSTSGFVGVAGGMILGCDIFHSPSIYRKFENKLLRSYALDAIEHRKPTGMNCGVPDFFQEIMQAVQKKARIGKSNHFSLKSGSLSGQGTIYHGKVIHLSAFPK
jgi:hypothetical protein